MYISEWKKISLAPLQWRCPANDNPKPPYNVHVQTEDFAGYVKNSKFEQRFDDRFIPQTVANYNLMSKLFVSWFRHSASIDHSEVA